MGLSVDLHRYFLGLRLASLHMSPNEAFPPRSVYDSADPDTGLMSTTGVPSIASIGPTYRRPGFIFKTFTRWSPSGLGRCGDRVENTPVTGRDRSFRGWTLITSLSARCSQVITMISSPTCIRCRAFLYQGSTSIRASGAPSKPCRGVSSRRFNSERMYPIGLIENLFT